MLASCVCPAVKLAAHHSMAQLLKRGSVTVRVSQALGLDPGADADDIRSAFRKAAMVSGTHLTSGAWSPQGTVMQQQCSSNWLCVLGDQQHVQLTVCVSLPLVTTSPLLRVCGASSMPALPTTGGCTQRTALMH